MCRAEDWVRSHGTRVIKVDNTDEAVAYLKRHKFQNNNIFFRIIITFLPPLTAKELYEMVSLIATSF